MKPRCPGIPGNPGIPSSPGGPGRPVPNIRYGPWAGTMNTETCTPVDSTMLLQTRGMLHMHVKGPNLLKTCSVHDDQTFSSGSRDQNRNVRFCLKIHHSHATFNSESCFSPWPFAGLDVEKCHHVCLSAALAHLSFKVPRIIWADFWCWYQWGRACNTGELGHLLLCVQPVSLLARNKTKF